MRNTTKNSGEKFGFPLYQKSLSKEDGKTELKGIDLSALLKGETNMSKSKNNTSKGIVRLNKPIPNSLIVKTFSLEKVDFSAFIENFLPEFQHCKVCGVIQTLKNTSETRKGSGKLRSKCKKCTYESQYKRKNPKPTKLKFPHLRVTLNLSSTEDKNQKPIVIEHNDPVGRAVQTFFKLCPKCGQTVHDSDVLFCPKCERTYPPGYGGLQRCPVCSKSLRYADQCPDCGIVTKIVKIETDRICRNCGSVVRYDEIRNKVCEGCGLTSCAIDAELVGHAWTRKPGERKVVFNRNTEWEQIERKSEPPTDPYQPSFWRGPDDNEEKVATDIDPADVPKNDGELLKTIKETKARKDKPPEKEKTPRITRKQRIARAQEIRTLVMIHIRNPVAVTPQEIIGVYQRGDDIDC